MAQGLVVYSVCVKIMMPPLPPPSPPDPAVPRVSEMSLDEKIGQMVMVPAWTMRISSAAIKALKIGAVIV